MFEGFQRIGAFVRCLHKAWSKCMLHSTVGQRKSEQPPTFNQAIKPQRLVTACKSWENCSLSALDKTENLLLDWPPHPSYLHMLYIHRSIPLNIQKAHTHKIHVWSDTHTYKTKIRLGNECQILYTLQAVWIANKILKGPAQLNTTCLGSHTQTHTVVFLLVRSMCKIRGMQALPWLLPKATGSL